MTQLKPIQGSYFVCKALGVQLFLDQHNHVIGRATLTKEQEGPPDLVHGGASAAILDEAMGAAVWNAGHQVVAANLHFNYRLPVPLGVEITLTANVDRVEGRKVFALSELVLPDGRVAVEGQGLFIHAPQFFQNADEFVRAFKTGE